MSLTEQLAAANAEGIKRIAPETVEIMMGAVKAQIESGIAEQSAKEGSAAPGFALPNASGNQVAAADLLNEGPLVVSFYRGGWCPYCNIELRALQERLPEIHDLGAKLVAISPETPDNSLTTQEKHDLAFEVLSDRGNQVARAFGLVFKLPADVSDIYKNKFGIDLAAYNGDDSDELPIPATFVIGRDGTILKSFVEPDYTKRLDPDDIITSLKAAR